MPAASAKKSATLHDVARKAHVSQQTVSRVVNEHPNVAPETRTRVLQAIRELDYRPNRAARSLITGRSQTIQVVNFVIHLAGPVPSILNTTRELGYNVSVSAVNAEVTKTELQKLFDELTGHMVDGFLFINLELNIPYDEMVRMCRGIPFVQIGVTNNVQVPAVVFDQSYGAQSAVQHLIDLGHRHIAEIQGEPFFTHSRQRHEGYLRAMNSHNLAPGPYQQSAFLAEGGYNACNALLDSGEHFTAIFCHNDQIALGSLRSLSEHGLQVPKDVSLVGFDDDNYAAYFTPPLTTVRQDYAILGRQSVQYLVSLIEDPDMGTHQRILYPQLIVRQSTRPI